MRFRYALLLILLIRCPPSGITSAQETPVLRDRVEARFDVVGAFTKLPQQGRIVKFERGNLVAPDGGHLQGIQVRRDQKRDFAFLSHDSKTEAYFLIVEFPRHFVGKGRVLHLQRLPSDGEEPPLRHAGGIQLCGDVLVLGLEDNQAKLRSEIQFWNVRTPDRPIQMTHLTIRRRGAETDQTAGAVGLAKRKDGHVLAVANWDSRAMDFYISNGKSLQDPQCRFSFAARWDSSKADRRAWQPNDNLGAYQAINLIADADGELCLLGFNTTSQSKDFVDLFHVDLNQTSAQLTKLANKRMMLTNGNHFLYGGGMFFLEDTLQILSSEGRLNKEACINIITGPE
ncbi:hypothetical protein V5E97_19050 [Singulisphaera sp. Ch08]|uniref:Phytase-like domain-containing protein n=1 Tax=Singulisphaera sp. Ch08 TaxID=3120278 RepID=A0AAU7CSE9_9BACT